MKEIKDEHLDKLNTPNYMWVTFKTDTSVQAALNQKKFKFGERKFRVERAQHPTDIKYENREISPASHAQRKYCFATFVTLLGVAFFFTGNYLIERMQIISFMQQPPLTNCDSMRSHYDDEALLSLAFQEFLSLKRNRRAHNLNMNNVISRNGALYCFCEEEIQDLGLRRSHIFSMEYSEKDGSIGTMSAPICKRYYQYMTGIGYIMQNVFSYLIVIASFLVRYLIIWVASKVRFFSLTKETKYVFESVFWITFLNYGIIYLVAAYDSRSDNHFLSNRFNGLYPDLNALWFNDIGVLVVAIMISNMYWPQLEFGMFWGIRLLYRMWDQRSLIPTKPSNTHCKTPQAFEEIYAGPEFDLSYKYSYILVVTYVTFLFGAGVPILFPIAYLSLLGFYIVERLMMAYSYKRPPMFGTETN